MNKTTKFAIVAAAITALGGAAFAATPATNATTATHPAKASVAQAAGAKQEHAGTATKAGMEHGKKAGENDAMAINQAKVSIGAGDQRRREGAWRQGDEGRTGAQQTGLDL